MGWQAGEQILLRYFGDWRSRRPTGVYPVTVVEDSASCIAVYFAVGTQVKRPARADGSPIPRSLPYEQRYTLATRIGDGVWHTEARLMLTRPGAAHAYSLFWNADDWSFNGWYVDLQAPFRRTAFGFDSEDQVLDIVIDHDLSWRWKDEDELDAAIRVGRFSFEGAAAIRAEGERVARNIEARGWPFEGGWESWRPDPDWPVPAMPDDWDYISAADGDSS